ncbi:uncharacterized protein MEPE_02956 [Melanopsichium pennsylvanicum]|uniref:PIN domain-containing protein n=2 Tax=Melanopsichium pennsylvanicum TaxID=63383 RepID=A0AAJ4XNG4_9BASI|nr:hypothetical protein BN887_01110 [Melanopsichium pennsylvanicum 4]SNX84248.1 uncharacterized protein MEPE_02956 [Melanopsichium pennsylvanicum]
MPTYADLWNEQQAALGQSGPSNPVRLIISKGDYVWDSQSSRFVYVEEWEEEHLMDHEELVDETYLTAAPSERHPNSRDSTPPPIAALQPASLQGYVHQPSLWVLDTNTLISCLGLLKALFAALLTRNVAYASSLAYPNHASSRPSSIKLVIPYVVVSELDGLKITRRNNESGRPVALQAREANHWLLSALQKQKRVPIDESGSTLDELLWPLFLQTSTHYSQSKRSKRTNGSSWMSEDALSCDDEIVKFCVDLKRQTTANVCFCSDDINARTKAELDGIDSLGMREMVNALMSNVKNADRGETKWMMVADALIDQWEYQIGTPHDQQPDVTQMQQNVRQPSTGLVDHQNVHSQPLRISSHQTAAPIYNDLVEVDMQTEDHASGPQTCTIPIFPSPVQHVPSAMRFSLSAEGRKTTDSMHSPHNAQRMMKQKPDQPTDSPSRYQPEAPTAPISTDQKQAMSESLNPQIDWEDLIEQHGTTSRTGNKQRNSRW